MKTFSESLKILEEQVRYNLIELINQHGTTCETSGEKQLKIHYSKYQYHIEDDELLDKVTVDQGNYIYLISSNNHRYSINQINICSYFNVVDYLFKTYANQPKEIKKINKT